MTIEIYADNKKQELTIRDVNGNIKTITYNEFLEVFKYGRNSKKTYKQS